MYNKKNTFEFVHVEHIFSYKIKKDKKLQKNLCFGIDKS